MDNEILAAALEYVRHGFSVIPVNRDKKPTRKWKEYQQQRPSEAELRHSFAGTDFNVAIIMGPVSGGLASRDFDADGSYGRWAAEYPDLATTLPTVTTGRPGGRHIYFQLAPEVLAEIQRASGKPLHGAVPLGDGELKVGSGSYVVAPPSIHSNGTMYRWIVPLGDAVPETDPRTAGLLRDWSAADTSGVGVAHSTEGTEVTEGRDVIISASSAYSAPSVEVEKEATAASSVVSVDSLVESAIRKTLPTQPGQRHHREFELARELKAIPALCAKDVANLEPYVRRWYELALPIIGTKDWDTVWWDFQEAWEDVLFPAGEAVATECFAKAVKRDPPHCAAGYESEKVRLLATWCHELQKAKGAQPFFLSCRTAGRHLGIDEKTASLWLRGFCGDKVLKVVERPPRGSLRAIRYQFVGAV